MPLAREKCYENPARRHLLGRRTPAEHPCISALKFRHWLDAVGCGWTWLGIGWALAGHGWALAGHWLDTVGHWLGIGWTRLGIGWTQLGMVGHWLDAVGHWLDLYLMLSRQDPAHHRAMIGAYFEEKSAF